MKHVIEIGDDVEQALERRATATGDDMVQPIQRAAESFARGETNSLSLFCTAAGRALTFRWRLSKPSPRTSCRELLPAQSPLSVQPAASPTPLRIPHAAILLAE